MKKILVVDDNVLMVDIAASFFQDNGYEVSVAYDANEALLKIEEGFVPNLLFTDIVMPGPIDGIDLAKMVQRKFPDTEVILATGWADVSDVKEKVLLKPYDLSEAKQMIDELLS